MCQPFCKPREQPGTTEPRDGWHVATSLGALRTDKPAATCPHCTKGNPHATTSRPWQNSATSKSGQTTGGAARKFVLRSPHGATNQAQGMRMSSTFGPRPCTTGKYAAWFCTAKRLPHIRIVKAKSPPPSSDVQRHATHKAATHAVIPANGTTFPRIGGGDGCDCQRRAAEGSRARCVACGAGDGLLDGVLGECCAGEHVRCTAPEVNAGATMEPNILVCSTPTAARPTSAILSHAETPWTLTLPEFVGRCTLN